MSNRFGNTNEDIEHLLNELETSRHCDDWHKHAAACIRSLRARAEEAERQLKAGPDKVLRCAFCGEPYPEGTPTHKSELLAAHIRVCPSHPVGIENRNLRAKSDRDLKALQELTGSNNVENPWLGVAAGVSLMRTKLDACAAAGFIAPNGEVRRVHSTGRIDVPDSMFPPNLPVTADEVIVIPGGTHYVWYPGDTKGRRVWLSGDMRWFGVHGDYHKEAKPIGKCYSTREAACFESFEVKIRPGLPT